MPSWSEYRAIAKERGALAFELYVVESNLKVAPEEMQKHLPDHLAYQGKMEAAGHLFLAGPLSDEAGEGMSGNGLIIYRAANLDEAKNFADGDPMHERGIKTYRIRKWLVNEGSLAFGLNLSSQSVSVR